MKSKSSTLAKSEDGGFVEPAPIDVMLKGLELRDDEEEDVVLDEDLEKIQEDARWLALAHVHTEKKSSHGSLFGNMRSAWNCAQEVEFRALENNLFSIQFHYLGDWERVMQEGPWIFRGCHVLIGEYDGWAEPETVVLNTYPVWVQVHDPKEKMRTSSIAMHFASLAGKVIKLDEALVKGHGKGVKVRVLMDVHKPLTRCTGLTVRKMKQYYRLMYEKLLVFCGVCRLVGHVTKEHADGVHAPDAIKYPLPLR
ncbi:uncharacterized protein LOC133914832 [Phragmites australis]|uniref:uncharacterized protein LOC133914832 n=1 Tax=Phragmites australis TaxID=29695 RepID=UPI002D7748F5|nr:uncharacterized protein LOC133914832 [Phragmites australis]